MALVTSKTFDTAMAIGLSEIAPSSGNAKLLIYKGTMPADPDTWSEAGSSSDELASTTTFTLTHDATGTPLTLFNSPPSSFDPTADGTAAWWVLVRVGAATEYCMGEVSTTAGGTGTLFLENLALVAPPGSPVVQVVIEGFGVAFNGLGA